MGLVSIEKFYNDLQYALSNGLNVKNLSLEGILKIEYTCIRRGRDDRYSFYSWALCEDDSIYLSFNEVPILYSEVLGNCNSDSCISMFELADKWGVISLKDIMLYKKLKIDHLTDTMAIKGILKKYNCDTLELSREEFCNEMVSMYGSHRKNIQSYDLKKFLHNTPIVYIDVVDTVYQDTLGFLVGFKSSMPREEVIKYIKNNMDILTNALKMKYTVSKSSSNLVPFKVFKYESIKLRTNNEVHISLRIKEISK